jgi:hypothetical protein
VLARPHPPSLSTNVTGDSTLAARALPHLAGALDRVSIATVDGTTVTYAHFGANGDTVYEKQPVSTGEAGEASHANRQGLTMPLDSTQFHTNLFVFLRKNVRIACSSKSVSAPYGRS